MIKNKINQNIEIIDKIFFELIKDTSITTKEQFQKFKNKFYKWQKMKEVIPDIIFINRYNELIKNNKIKYEIRIAKLIRKRAIRSLSWVSVISILTKNWIVLESVFIVQVLKIYQKVIFQMNQQWWGLF
jgi:hypothetical protein